MGYSEKSEAANHIAGCGENHVVLFWNEPLSGSFRGLGAAARTALAVGVGVNLSFAGTLIASAHGFPFKVGH